jgi:tRNA-(ms[2]io[6]A)-hydroxylase
MVQDKRVLGLQLPTDPRWVNLAEADIEEILTDHAYCEQKAASSCISLITKYPDFEELVERLSPVVTEEWGHFRMVLRELKKRGFRLGRQRKDEYVNELQKHVRKDGAGREEVLLDRLLVFALIEARSCERFRLLSLHIADEDLKKFYHELMVAEAGHYRMFIELAEKVTGEERARERWTSLLQTEAAIVAELEPRGDRMH